MIRVSVSTVYEFTEEMYDEYLLSLVQFMTEPQLAEFIATGRVERVNTEQGSSVITVHELVQEDNG